VTHVSIWRFAGDPDDLLRRYDAMTADMPALQPIPPEEPHLGSQ
jgi:hypothetical protein